MSKHTSENKPPILKGEGIPEFNKITPNQIQEFFPILLKDLTEKYIDLENNIDKRLKAEAELEWGDVMTPLHELGEELRWSWGVVSHLNAVQNSTELREAYLSQQPEVIRFSNLIGQSKTLHKALLRLKGNKSVALNEAQKRILETELISMINRGVGLEGAFQDEFNKDSERLAELSTLFSNNVLDSTKEWSLLLTKKEEVEGLPARTLELLANAAIEAGDKSAKGSQTPNPAEGPWRLGLDMPRYIAFITYGKNRAIREKLYKAYVSRASEGQVDNKSLIEEILTIRKRQANRLGYESWANLSLSQKMAKDISEVECLLNELKEAAMPAARRELEDLRKCAIKNGSPNDSTICPWDISFWSECLRQERFDLNQEELRPWFPLDQVLEALFDLCRRLFNISIEVADGEAPIWHQDVRFFRIRDLNGLALASFYLDPFSRPDTKRGGAWMDECISRNKTKDGDIILPIAYLVCNQTPPTKQTPSLMSFEEVETLFHEFGHGLQHMLTTVDYPQAAGINNVEWDAVELPSQFLENWCLEKKTLSQMARHWKTGEPLPEVEYQKLRKSRTFNSGFATLRQVHFAMTDLKLHSSWCKDEGKSPDEIRREISKETSVITPIPEDQYLCAFSHIFAGGYSAGYYSYKWAEVLSADAYSAFEEAGLTEEIQLKKLGMKFRQTILSMGGSKSPEVVYKAFRGRKATTEALIRHSGLIKH